MSVHRTTTVAFLAATALVTMAAGTGNATTAHARNIETATAHVATAAPAVTGSLDPKIPAKEFSQRVGDGDCHVTEQVHLRKSKGRLHDYMRWTSAHKSLLFSCTAGIYRNGKWIEGPRSFTNNDGSYWYWDGPGASANVRVTSCFILICHTHTYWGRKN